MNEPTQQTPSISMIIPVYNEGDLLKDTMPRCLSTLYKIFDDFEIILVNDGSNKNDSNMMDSIAKMNNNVRVIHNNINLNLGISIQRGFAEALKDLVIFNSIDLPLAPEDIKNLVAHMNGCDLLVIERNRYSGASLWRKVTSKINRLLIKILFPVLSLGIRDLNYTFIAKRSILPSIMPLAKSPAFTQPEMILRAKQKKFIVASIKADYHARTKGKASLGKPHDILWSFYDMIRFRLVSLIKTSQKTKVFNQL